MTFAGLALQGIHLESRVVGHHPPRKMAGGVDGFQDRIGFECFAGFFHRRQLRHPSQIAKLKFAPKNFSEFSRLVRVAGCEQERVHQLE